VQEIANAGPFWNEQWRMIHRLRAIPTLLCWGMKDRFFPTDLLERWKEALPHAQVEKFASTGHFVHEEAATELTKAMQRHLEAASHR
jgi:haloalkane dehalogenase